MYLAKMSTLRKYFPSFPHLPYEFTIQFCSLCQDTLAAWEALQQYSLKMDTSRDTRLAVTVEPLLDIPQSKLLNSPFALEPDEVITCLCGKHGRSFRISSSAK